MFREQTYLMHPMDCLHSPGSSISPVLEVLRSLKLLIVGGASGPTGLIILGASLGTLNLRHGLPPWFHALNVSNSRGSIVLMALLKLAVLPIIGVLWTQLLTFHSPLVHENQTMLRFVMILL